MFFTTNENETPKQPQRARFRGGNPGRHAPNERKIQLHHLWEVHHRMLRLAVLGMSHKDIAATLGVHHITVANCINSALGQKRLQEMRGAADKNAVDTAAKLREMNEKSIAVLEEILDDEEAPRALRAKVAMDNLSRTGFAPQINVRGVMDHRHFGTEDLERIKTIALEAAKRNGCLVLEDHSAGERSSLRLDSSLSLDSTQEGDLSEMIVDISCAASSPPNHAEEIEGDTAAALARFSAGTTHAEEESEALITTVVSCAMKGANRGSGDD